MKKIFCIMMLPLLLIGCGEDKNVYVDPDQFEAPKVVSTSIAEGATVKADTKQLVVTYDADVLLNPLAKVIISQGEVISTEIIGERRLVVGLSLSPGKKYTVTVPGNTVLGRDSKKYASTLELTFSTESGPSISSQVARNLTNGKATEPTRKLYAALLENYGKKQISGAMGEVAWDTGFCDMIYDVSGKYPAIVGFDYIHLGSSSPDSWINYGDISPVRKIWEAGSVPAISWHWNVPTSEDGKDVNFNAQNNNFKASNVLVEGTWENKVAVEDVKKLAGYLKLLQDAGIPVLWRPFHEAAGDYRGHWFWWGNSGVDVTKKLWVWLRDKLTNEYGLNNLIWVWTVQTSDAGKPAPMAKIEAAYPGDDVVDIVGADLYVDAFSNQTAQFEMLYNLVGGKKMVALTECGNLLDVDSAFKDGALWSFFMGWYDMNSDGKLGFHVWNTNSEWKTVLNNPLVINQGQLGL